MTNLEQYKEFLLARKQSLVYYTMINIYFKWLLSKSLSEERGADKEVVTKFFIEHKYSPNSQNNFIKAGRSYYGIFKNINKEYNEWLGMKLIQPDQKDVTAITEEEFNNIKKSLVSYFSNTMSVAKIEALLAMMFYCGLRKGELLILKRSDINLEEKSIKLFGKGRKERVVYFPDDIKTKFIKYFNSEAEGINAFNMSRGKMAYLTKKMSEYCRNKKITPHTLRHSAARNWIKKGIDIHIIQQLLGHSNIQTTMIYVRPDAETIKQAYQEKMNGK